MASSLEFPSNVELFYCKDFPEGISYPVFYLEPSPENLLFPSCLMIKHIFAFPFLLQIPHRRQLVFY